ncbi:hypothetical protein SEVIR_5G424501v4 [Setaria viridis]|uniref:Uncharacterized protein n=1 Tax=Setaria viridis TaxID=4556 RepID=A0A4V6D7I1_SETVI|nr:hypothetical protein SEVIR_5G424501v2 [Setaria viridis]
MGFQSFSCPGPGCLETVELEEGKRRGISSVVRVNDEERELKLRSFNGMGIGRWGLVSCHGLTAGGKGKARGTRSRCHWLCLLSPSIITYALIERGAGTLTTAGLFHVEPCTTCRTFLCCGDSNCMTGKSISFFINCFFTSIHLLKEI